MPFPVPAPVLAAPDIGTVISIAILIIGFLGWLRQQVAQHQPPPAAPPRPPRPPRGPERGADRMQDEIEIFLQEVGGRRPPARPRAEEAAIEIVPESERRTRPVPPRPTPQRPQTPRRPSPASGRAVPAAPSRSTAPSAEAASRRPASQPPDTGREAELPSGSLLKHLQSVIESGRLDAQVRERLRRELNQLAREQAAVAVPPGGQAMSSARGLAMLLRSPAGMRQAVLMNEILSPPKALREPAP